MGKKNISSSVTFKLTVVLICFVILQSVLLASLMVQGGVLKQVEANQYRSFSEKANGRSNNLENQMKNIRMNPDYDMEQISQLFEIEADAKQADQILEEMTLLVMDAMLRTKITGAFLVIPKQREDVDHLLPVLYSRNNNPNRSSRENSNLYMSVGPWNVAEKIQIATMADQSFRLNMIDSNQAFVTKPYEAVREIGKPKWLGYWSPPFKVNPQDKEVITHSTPLFGADGNVKAIFGVEMSISYLYHLPPASDLQTANAYGYVPGIRDEGGQLRAAATHGAMQKRMLEEGEPLDLTSMDQENSVYRLMDHKSNEKIFACLNPMGMYYYNTLFESEEWYIIGLIKRSVPLQFPGKVGRILNYPFLVSIIIGFITAIITSRWLTRHAELIELSGFPVGVFEIGGYPGRVYMTSQIPRLFNLTREQEWKFSRGKNQLIAFLKELKSLESGEEGAYKTEAEGEYRWIKITRKNSEDLVRRVVEDVTDEVLQTKVLKKERDRGGFIGVKNRMAFGTVMEQIKGRLGETLVWVLVMCDLNDLKGVNDASGHDKGDEYTRAAADATRDLFLRGQVSRIGGDEFVAILSGVSPQEVEEGVQILRCTMEEYSSWYNFDASVAAGTAFYDPVLDPDLEGTLNRADVGMYTNKGKIKAQGVE